MTDRRVIIHVLEGEEEPLTLVGSDDILTANRRECEAAARLLREAAPREA